MEPRKPQPSDEDGDFPTFRRLVNEHFQSMTEPFFKVPSNGLADLFLEALPKSLQQHYNCNCCRSFINHYGGLVTVSAKGKLISAIWPDLNVPEAFQDAVTILRSVVEDSSIATAFVTSDINLGMPETPPWTHLAVPVAPAMRWTSHTVSASQRAAEIQEELKMLKRALADFPKSLVEKACTLLQSGTLYRSNGCLAITEWLLPLYGVNENKLWVSAATAPAGFCHLRSGMIGTLLEDLQNNLPIERVKERFDEKMNPTNYQRAQAAPSAGNVAQAEKIIAKLEAEGALRRAYARFEEIPQFIWCGGGTIPKTGTFGHLVPKTKAPAQMTFPTQTITWEKFRRTVLPSAQSIEIQVPATTDRFMSLITAGNCMSPPVVQWDTTENPNPFTWYYAAGVDAEIRDRVVRAGGTYEGVSIRASLIWNNRNDLDLHCITPCTEEIFYARKRSVCGGYLDVDMNVRGESTAPVENIRWLKGQARPGHYRFYVQHYRNNQNSYSTPFKVELEIDGKLYQHNDVMYKDRWNGGVDRNVFEFDYANGLISWLGGQPTPGTSLNNSWGVTPGQWVKVNGIINSPNVWSNHPQSLHHIFFLMEGVKDTQKVGRGLFTEMLKSDFHPIRSTLEAYLAQQPITGESTASGLGFNKENPWNITVRVQTKDSTTHYLIDRWD